MIWVLGVIFFVVAGLPWLFVRFGALHRGPRHALVALTIDDGPYAETTPALLEALGDTPATFFCVGERLDANPALGQALARRGHELANHSYAHAHTLAFWLSGRSERDLRRAQAVLERFGPTPRYFRAVAGVLSPPLYWAARRVGLTPVHWTATARDGALSISPALAMRRLRRGLRPGGILVIHDRPNAPALVHLLKQEAQTRNLRFVTLSELLAPLDSPARGVG